MKYRVMMEITSKFCIEIESEKFEDAKMNAKYTVLPLLTEKDVKIVKIQTVDKDDNFKPEEFLSEK